MKYSKIKMNLKEESPLKMTPNSKIATSGVTLIECT